MKFSFKNSFFLMLLLLAVIECVFYFINPFIDAEKAQYLDRNPNHKFGWPEYVDGSKDEGKKLAILIGNSQSYGLEMKNSNDIYFHGLKNKLAEKNANLQFENWSLGGLRTCDLELLTIKAKKRKADYIFYILNAGTFDYIEQTRLGYANTDVQLLVSQLDMWPDLNSTIVGRQTKTDNIVKNFLGYHSNIIRCRFPLYFKLSKFVPRHDQIFYFGKPVKAPREFDMKKMAEFRKKFTYAQERNAGETAMDIKKRKTTMVAFFESLTENFANTETKIVFIWMPISTSRAKKEKNHDNLRAFNSFGSKILDKQNIINYDLTTAISDSLFVSLGHFNKNGHKKFIEKIYPIIENEL